MIWNRFRSIDPVPPGLLSQVSGPRHTQKAAPHPGCLSLGTKPDLKHFSFNMTHFVCFWRVVWQGTARSAMRRIGRAV
jgi:hypothetical protein